ncbi:short-chain dehydrogenase [Sphingobium sp. C100]|nr:short-chain dehydrogenase [Sphingobium sp. C100]
MGEKGMKASDMRGKAALVTGAAGGLGRETALALARAGAHVMLADVNRVGLEETAGLLARLDVEVRCCASDLTLADNCRAAINDAVEVFGRLDALCNVAGVIVFAHSADMAQADWERTIAVNLNAPFYLAQAAVPHLLESHGAIVNVTSSAAFIGEAYLAAYCASKGGLTQLTKSLAMEYMHTPLRVNAVAPGGMITPMGRTIHMPEGVDQSLIGRYRPQRGQVAVEDVADLIAFLCSDAARGYHGASIVIDNGQIAG